MDVDQDLVLLGFRVLPLDEPIRQLLGLDVLLDHVGFPVEHLRLSAPLSHERRAGVTHMMFDAGQRSQLGEELEYD